jgi:hypothetical protein
MCSFLSAFPSNFLLDPQASDSPPFDRNFDHCSIMSIFDLGAQKLIDGSELDMKSIAGKPALAMNVASR